MTTTDESTIAAAGAVRRYKIGEPSHDLTRHSRSGIVRLLVSARVLKYHQNGREYVHMMCVNSDESPAAKELRDALEAAMDYGPGRGPRVRTLFSE